MATPTGAPTVTVALSATKTTWTKSAAAETAAESGPAETRSAESGSTESAEKSTTRLLCRSFPLMSLPPI